tara:strand:+ start:675 stop:1301 length:627 start_codon:yes stop_codon:yes gene_type:complete
MGGPINKNLMEDLLTEEQLSIISHEYKSGLYAICGVPNSGKTTSMRFLCKIKNAAMCERGSKNKSNPVMLDNQWPNPHDFTIASDDSNCPSVRAMRKEYTGYSHLLYLKNYIKFCSKNYDIVCIDEPEFPLQYDGNEKDSVEAMKEVKQLANDLGVILIMTTHCKDFLLLSDKAFFIDGRQVPATKPIPWEKHTELKQIVKKINNETL